MNEPTSDTTTTKRAAQRQRAMGHRAMALGWLKRGRVKQAIEGLQKAIDLDPFLLEAVLELCRILQHLRRWDDLAALCHQALEVHLATPELHKTLITALEEKGSLEDAFAHYELVRRDHRCMAIAPDEMLCCLVARNERPRLSYLLDYYRRLGIDRFFVCDNGSDDGSVEWLLEQPDVHVWTSDLSFKQANFGSAWFELLLRRHGVGHWCLTIDADEFLYFDGTPQRTLKQFCRDLERRGKQAATGMMLDLYGDRPIRKTLYRAGDDPLDHCHFFDRKAWHEKIVDGSEYRNQNAFWGGVRNRVFPADHGYFLSKCVLLRYQPDVVLTSGQHLTNIPAERLAKEEVCVLHFKFFASFSDYARQEADREIHAMGGAQYKTYHRKLSEEDRLTLYDPEHSVRFEGARQLQELEILSPEPILPAPHVPTIPARPASVEPPPFWSVMVTVYNRPHNVERVLGSVLSQADPQMQIAVVCDHSDPETQQRIAAETHRVGGGRVEFLPESTPLGHPGIFNRCIELARGRWVHILHDDDWVEPGYYSALRAGIEAEPSAGAAFCQHSIVEHGPKEPTTWHSWVERETPGLIANWLERIALECRVQFSAMAVRRDVYEAVGGFCPDAASAFDWEMWTRIAARYPVFYVPETLVGVGRDDTAESSRLMRSGEQVQHAFTAIDVMSRHLPPQVAGRLEHKARDRIASYALEIAQQYVDRGDASAALANLRAAVLGRPSSRTCQRLADVLRSEHYAFQG
jgi:glycosyltransferase involved in cell wall biosynthesis/Tfp pilus assembly protein PilF